MIDRMRFEDFVPVAAELLENGSEHSFEVPNSDMMPLLRDFYDTVTMSKPAERLEKNDVVLYQGDNGDYFVSRIVYRNGDNYSLSCDGSNETCYNISRDRIIGKMTSFYRKDNKITVDNKYYSFYVMLLPLIKGLFSFYSTIKAKINCFIKSLSDR